MNGRFTTAKTGPLRLGRELGRGGEGAVFDVTDHADVVAKLYHSPPDRDKGQKLVEMANGCTNRLLSISAWPIDTIRDAVSGAIRGFLMRRVARQRDIHFLYGPKTRLRHYPDATYRFLVHVAANLARAFAVVHDHGHVIGDVNQGGVCVSVQGTVTLVDCDSFQIRASQKIFSCNVGIPIYQPPELQNARSFQGLARTVNYDNFGLAVLIFQTLFLARHPFAGTYQGDADMPIERAIRELRFAYGRDAAKRQMKQPPGSLGLGAVPPVVAELFERAFLESGAQGNRPSAIEWVTALDEFLSELRECQGNSGHAFARTLTKCPLCEIEGRVGVLLFIPQRQAVVRAPEVNIEELWRELVPVIESAQLPAVSLSNVPKVSPPESVRRFAIARSRATTVLYIGVAVSVLLAIIWHPGALAGAAAFPAIARLIRGSTPDEAQNVSGRLSDARQRVNAIHRNLERERMASTLPTLEARAHSLYRSLMDFPRRRAEQLREYERGRYERQLRRFLDQFEVKDARLRGFGPGLFATLVSNGIETADDIEIKRFEGIGGFGPKRISILVEWRRVLESRFKYNPSDPTDVRERGQVEWELQVDYAKEVAEFQRVAEQIKVRTGPFRQRTATLTKELVQTQHELAITQATAVALGKRC